MVAFYSNSCSCRLSTDEEEQAELGKKTEALIADEAKLSKLDLYTQSSTLIMSGLSHMGQIAGVYSTPTVPFDRADKGAVQMLRACLKARERAAGLADGYDRGNTISWQFLAHGLCTLANVRAMELIAAKPALIGEGGALVVMWFASYEMDWHAYHVADNQDPYHGMVTYLHRCLSA